VEPRRVSLGRYDPRLHKGAVEGAVDGAVEGTVNIARVDSGSSFLTIGQGTLQGRFTFGRRLGCMAASPARHYSWVSPGTGPYSACRIVEKLAI
jgi:hypothetical protein